MKRAAAACAILAVILIFSVCEAVIIKKENSRLYSLLDGIQSCYESGDISSAARGADEFETLWAKYHGSMSVLVEDDRLNELDTSAAKLRPYIEDKSDELEAEIENIRRRLDLIYRSELPLWYNLF